MKGEFFVVDYKIQDETKYSDIIPSDKIRAPNKSPSLSLNSFHKVSFKVPDDLHDMWAESWVFIFFEHGSTNIFLIFSSYKVENPYKEFRKACGAIAAHFDEKNNTLSVICDKESSAKRATFISEMHFKNLRQKATILKRKEEIAQQIEVCIF